MRRLKLGLTTLVIASSSLLILGSVMTTAEAANSPGDPCPTNGAVMALGQGSIECVAGTWQPGTSAPGGQSTSTVKASKNFTTVGPVLSATTFNSTGKQVADATAFRLPNGRIRLFAFVNASPLPGLKSATSTTAAGTTFVNDGTDPFPGTPIGQPRAVALGGNSLRLFFVEAGNIAAAVSSDGGVTFTREGPVITTEQAGFEPGVLSLVKKGGIYRAYFSNLEKPGERAARVMKTATSTDMLHWTMGPTLSMSGSHPFAVMNSAGKIALYYAADRGSSYGIFLATGTDGVTFTNERLVIAGGGDPDIISAGRKKWLMYYGSEISPALGFGVFLARSVGNVVP